MIWIYFPSFSRLLDEWARRLPALFKKTKTKLPGGKWHGVECDPSFAATRTSDVTPLGKLETLIPMQGKIMAQSATPEHALTICF